MEQKIKPVVVTAERTREAVEYLAEVTGVTVEQMEQMLHKCGDTAMREVNHEESKG